MTDMQLLVEQIVADISTGASRLGEVRLRLFLKWLRAHRSKVKEAEQAHMEEAIQDQGNDRRPSEEWLEALV